MWEELAHGLPVPAELIALQERLTTSYQPREPVSTKRTKRPPPGSDPRGGAGGGNDLPTIESWCGNGCCDYAWLTANLCPSLSYDASWFLLDYGWSYANYNDIFLYHGNVCAAWGTSTYSVWLGDGSGGTWSVPQATYRNFHWLAAFSIFWCAGYCGEDMTSSVNNSSYQQSHTYCGGILFD